MYKGHEAGLGSAGGAAVLPLDQPFAGHAPVSGVLRARFASIRGWFDENDLVVDLGSRIGSREWCRGALTCIALCASAWSLGPSIEPFQGISAPPLGDSQWAESRAQGYSALAYGADTGRRMAPTDLVERLAEPPDRPRIELTATVGRGDSFVRALRRAGVAEADAALASDLVARAIPLGEIEPGTRMDLVLGRRATKRDPRPLDRLEFRARLELALAVERPEGGGPLALRRIPIAVDDTPLRIQGRVGSSLYRSARAAGVPARAVEAYLRALGSRMSVNRGISADAKFDVVIAQRRAETGEVEIGELLYAGLDQGKRKVQLVRWMVGGRPQWFEASGVGEQRGAFLRPVANGRLTSSFGMRRHPLLGYSRLHKGIDFGAPTGTPIMAAADGVVKVAGWNGGHGNYVKINHAGGLGTGYGHMSRIAVRAGQRVTQGTIIGYVGSTGLSTGPHLHYEMYKNGVAVNPTSVSFVTQATLSGAELRRFKATLAGFLAVRPGAEPVFPGRPAANAEERAELPGSTGGGTGTGAGGAGPKRGDRS